MNYLTITKCDQLNGDGLRVVLWVAGCSHKCPFCQNSYSWDENAGILFDDTAKNEIFEELKKDWCSGITFSGGDPLFANNRKDVIEFAKEIKQKFPNKTIWLYTGFHIGDVLRESSMREILNYVDVICDGPFVNELKDPDLKWVGSKNQKVLNVKSLKV